MQKNITVLAKNFSESYSVLHNRYAISLESFFVKLHVDSIELQHLMVPFDLQKIQLAHDIVGSYGMVDGIIVVGIGGSNGAARAIEQLINGVMNETKQCKIWWLETVDVCLTSQILDAASALLQSDKRVIAIVISKSGATFEIVANMELVVALFETYYGKSVGKNVIVCSDKGSPLEVYAQQIHAQFIEMPELIGGRFSAFAIHHLIILAFMGVDIDTLCQGARDITIRLQTNDESNFAILMAVFIAEAYQRGFRIYDLFVPGICWQGFGFWARQLIAESLGKKNRLDGSIINFGLTPTVTTCSTDLHSMAQLYVEGPQNQTITSFCMIESEEVSVEGLFSDSYKNAMNTLMRSVVDVYSDLQKPSLIVVIPEKNSYYIGALIQLFFVKILLLGHIFNINPYNQPGVRLFKDKFKSL